MATALARPNPKTLSMDLRIDWEQRLSALPREWPDFHRQIMRDAGLEPYHARVWHYCSLSSLMAMLGPEPISREPSSAAFRELWASSAQFLNDKWELQFGKQLLRERLITVAQSADSDDKGIFDLLIGTLTSANAQAVFSSSFSSKGDDLSQWRGYGDDGKGASICIDVEAAQRQIQGAFVKVLYVRHPRENSADDSADSEQSHAVIEASIKRVVQSIRGLVDTCKGQTALINELTELLQTELPGIWALIAMTMKDAGFQDEDEYRVVTTRAFSSDQRVFVRSSRCIPFVKLTMESTSLPIRAVCLGPGVPENTAASLMDTIPLVAPGVEVVRSKLPYIPS